MCLAYAQPSVTVERLLEDAGGDIGARRLSVSGAALSKAQLTCLVSLLLCVVVRTPPSTPLHSAASQRC